MAKSADFEDIDAQTFEELSSKTFLVTGANSGLGFSASRFFVKKNVGTLLFVCRSKEKAEKAIADIKSSYPDSTTTIKLHLCDLSSLHNVQALSDAVSRSEPHVDVIVSNAGAMRTPYDERFTTDEGLEYHLTVNYLSGVLLVERLLPLLQKSSDARVISVASGGGLTENLAKNDAEYEKGKWSNRDAYARTKRMQIAVSEYWAAKFPAITFVSMHPGWADTQAVKEAMPGFYEKLKSRLRTPDQGADTIHWLAVADKASLVSGEFYRDRAPEAKHLALAWSKYSDEDRDAAYAWTQTKIEAGLAATVVEVADGREGDGGGGSGGKKKKKKKKASEDNGNGDDDDAQSQDA